MTRGTMFDTILVPTDGSEAMARVIDTASELAETHDAALRFVYVVPTAAFLSCLPMTNRPSTNRAAPS